MITIKINLQLVSKEMIFKIKTITKIILLNQTILANRHQIHKLIKTFLKIIIR